MKTRVSILIKRTSLLYDKISNQLLTPYDLTSSQFKILMVLYTSPVESVRQADIETRFALSNPTVTGLIQKLEAKGLVQKMPHPEDKRSRFLVLTEAALAMEAEMRALGNQIEAQMAQGLSEAEYDQLAQLLEKMLVQNGIGNFAGE